MVATEVVQALVSPAEKLIEAVSGAIGKAYEPRYIKKMAKAKASEVEIISQAVRNNSDIPIVYNSAGISIDTSNFEEIAKRASSRLAYQEITKQQNIEAVADNAYEELENVEKVSPEPVDPDWMFRFFNSVENISNEDMQKIWGRILAGEIKSPNTYSYRTLEKLKNLTKQEAELFQHISSLALEHSDEKFIFSDKDILNKYDVYFSQILKLEECGLINLQELTLTFDISINQSVYIYNSETLGVIKGKGSKCQKLILFVYVFTESGSQLIEAIHPKVNNKYFIDCLESIYEKNKEKFTITAHEINDINSEMEISYKKENLLSHK